MKTFEQLKGQVTPELTKKLCELAEGFACNDIDEVFYMDVLSCEFKNIYEFVMFPLLLHRAVESKNIIIDYYGDFVFDIDNNQKYYFENYQLCHLAQCEMAILDCLIEVLK